VVISIKRLLSLYPIIVILLSGFVVFLWLDGKMLYFWDMWFPFNPPADIYYFSFTWNKLLAHGGPWTPNTMLMYWLWIYLFHNIFGLSIQVSQLTLVYILFTLSGLSMYCLITYLYKTFFRIKRSSLASLSGALVYMFNYYATYFLYSQIFPSWFLYSLLPLAIVVVLDGLKRSESGKVPIGNIIALVILFLFMSPGFWEPPYIVYTVFIFSVFFIAYLLDRKPPIRNIIKFLSLALLGIICTGLWWLYIFVHMTSVSISTISPGSYKYEVLRRALTTFSGNEPFRLLNLIRIYPPYFPIPNNVYTWQEIYSGPSPNLILLIASVIFTSVVFLPLINIRSISRKTSFYCIMYISVIFLLFFGAQGSNPLARSLFSFLYDLRFPLLQIFYITGAQFLMFPLIFFYAIGFGEGVACSENWLTHLFINFRHATKMRLTRLVCMIKPLCISLILLLSIVIYPWYLWTPQATQVYIGPNLEIMPSTVSFPSYFHEMVEYISSHAGESLTLILPLHVSFLAMKFDEGGFMCTFEPIRLWTGKPTFHGVASNALDGYLYWKIQDLLYGGINTTSFSNYLTSLNIKYILVVTNYFPSPGQPYANITKILSFLSRQHDIKLVKQFGPLYLYENLKPTRMIYAGKPFIFNPSIESPINVLNLSLDSITFTAERVGQPLLSNVSCSNGTLHFHFKYLKGVTFPLNRWINTEPLNIDLKSFHYLLITLKTSNNTLFSVYVRGKSKDVPLVPIHSLGIPYGKDSIYQQTGDKYYTLIYPLFGCNKIEEDELDWLIIGLDSYRPDYPNLPPSPSDYSCWIKSIAFASFADPSDIFMVLSSNIFDPGKDVIIHDNTFNIENFSAPLVEYSEVNPTLYLVNIRNATSPFILVFNQNFNEAWQARINGTSIDAKHHFIGNGYANAWYIDKKGNYQIVIEYIPQKTYNILVFISISSFVVLIVISVYKLSVQRLRKTNSAHYTPE